MNGTDMLMAELSRGMPAGPITALVSSLGGPGRAGGTVRAARQLGVVPRTIQRKMAGEAAAAGHAVRATERRGEKALRKAHAANMRGKQVHTQATGTVRVSQNYWTGLVDGDMYGFDPAKADTMWDAFAAGDGAAAFKAWSEGAFDGYGLYSKGGVEWENGELDSLDISFT